MRPDAGPTVVYEGAPAPAARPAWVLGGAGLLLLCLVWEAVARLGWVPALFLPAPTAVLAEAGRMARSGELGRHVGVSLARVGLGFGLGAAAGTVLGPRARHVARSVGRRQPHHRRDVPHPQDRAPAPHDPVARHR